MNEQEAKARRAELVPQLRAYGKLERVLWPIVTATAEPNFASDELNTDSRGHRVTRNGEHTARSDDAPHDAAFVSSYHHSNEKIVQISSSLFNDRA